MRRDQRRVKVDHDLPDQLPGSTGAGQLSTGELPAGQPRPFARFSAGLPDLREHPGSGRDRVQDPPDRRGRRDAPDRAVQTSLVGEDLDVADVTAPSAIATATSTSTRPGS